MDLEKYNKGRLVKRGLRILKISTKDLHSNESREGSKRGMLKGRVYDYYDSDIKTYLEDFKDLLNGAKDFNEYVEDKFSAQRGKLIGIELGGPGNSFFSGFDPGVFSKTAGFTLTNPYDLQNLKNHSVVEADVFLSNTPIKRSWKNVEEWVIKNGKPDFIIERMIGPLFIIKEPKIFLLILDRWYRILNEGGEIFAEVPKNMLELNYQELIDHVNNLKIDGLEIEIGRGHSTTAIVLKIKKLKNAPDSIAKIFSK